MKSFYIKGTTPNWDITGKKGHPFPIIAWLIRLFTFFNVSHVLYDFIHKNKVWHVQLTEVVCQDRLEFLNQSVRVDYIFEIQVPEAKLQKLCDFLEPQIGSQKGYFLQLFGIALLSPFRWFGIKLPNPMSWAYGNSQTCSQTIAVAFKEIFEVNWFDHIPANSQTQRDTIEILDKNRGNHGSIKVRRLR